MKKLKVLVLLVIIIPLLLSTASVFAKPYKLSERTVRELKVFRALQGDMADMQKLGNILISIAPFRSLLDGADPADAFEISQESWALFDKALQGLSVHYRSQLRQFCELEALSQHKSRDDFQFWRNLAKQFYPSKIDVDLAGNWKKRKTPQHRGVLPELQFSKSGSSYSGSLVIKLDEEEIKRPLQDIIVSGRSVSFYMMNGSSKITYLLRSAKDMTTLSGRVSGQKDKADIKFDKL
jgi:hypothetical protein